MPFKPVSQEYVNTNSVNNRRSPSSAWEEMPLDVWVIIDIKEMGFNSLKQAKRSLYHYGFSRGYGVRTKDHHEPEIFFGYLINQ